MKTARKAYNLIVEVGHVIPLAIYVLAQYHDKTDTANLLGWEWGANLLKTAPRDFGKGVLNHHIHRSRLRSIDELLDHCMH